MTQPQSEKTPPSLLRVRNGWYIACRSRALGTQPKAFSLFDTPIVLFRASSGAPGALLDRCPHRNVPLSAGTIRGEHLQCAYHGWEFDHAGACRFVPGLLGKQDAKSRSVSSFHVREQDGFVWVHGDPEAATPGEPFRFPVFDPARYISVTEEYELEGSVHAAAENALDVPHTAFLHRGLFRGSGKRNEITVTVRRWHDRVEAEYAGEPRPGGLAGRFLAPGGGTVEHFDRFFSPCIAQVEYRLGESSHLNITTAFTPVSDTSTRMFARVQLRVPPPAKLLARAVKPVLVRVVHQDAAILRKQAATIRRFGGESFVSTEIDVLGPHILQLLREAERGALTRREEPLVRTVRMSV